MDHVEGQVQNIWKDIFPDKSFEYFFLDELFSSHYREEHRFGKLLGVFTFLAIIVAGLGLYGMAHLLVIQRTKEVGVRKILGAPLPDLMVLLSKRFIYLVLIAGVIAIPFVHFTMSQWLEDYPYRILVTWWMLILPVALNVGDYRLYYRSSYYQSGIVESHQVYQA
jgi:putative ABC transport system permease protein